MAYLTAPDAVGAKQSCRYVVELASEQRENEGVPEFTRTIDLVVIMPTPDLSVVRSHQVLQLVVG